MSGTAAPDPRRSFEELVEASSLGTPAAKAARAAAPRDAVDRALARAKELESQTADEAEWREEAVADALFNMGHGNCDAQSQLYDTVDLILEDLDAADRAAGVIRVRVDDATVEKLARILRRQVCETRVNEDKFWRVYAGAARTILQALAAS